MDEKQLEMKRPARTTDHLANERTFLAWIRTGIAMISLGFVVARFSFWLREIAISTGSAASIPRTGLSLPIGLGMVAFGGVMTLLAAVRYRDMRAAIDNDTAHPRPTLIAITTGAVILLAVVLIVYLLAALRQF